MKKSLVIACSTIGIALAFGGFAGCSQESKKDAAIVSAAPEALRPLVKEALKEGQLTVIALPHDWVNYGEIIAKFSEKYGIKVNELNPDGSSGDELEAIKANKDNKGPRLPTSSTSAFLSDRRQKPTDSSSLTRSRHGTRSPRISRIPTDSGTATTTAPSRSK